MNRSLRSLLIAAAFAAPLCGCDERKPSNTAPEGAGTSAPAHDTAAAPRGAARVGTGSVDGRFHFADGTHLTPARTPTNDSVARHCGTEVEDRSLVESASGGIAWAVVSVDDAGGGEAPLTPAEQTVAVDNKGCQFAPVILGARAGATIALKNSDPLTHSVRGNEGGRDLFNVALPLEGMVTKKVLPKEPGIVRLVCDIHPWMNARIKTFAHPHFTSTDEDGRFHLDGIPAGHHRVTVWHPRLGEHSVELDVKEGAAASADVGAAGADVRPLE